MRSDNTQTNTNSDVSSAMNNYKTKCLKHANDYSSINERIYSDHEQSKVSKDTMPNSNNISVTL